MKSEQIKEITERATEQLTAALNAGHSEALTGYLKAIARFHRYSLHNVMLIASQKPTASYVAGFRTWNELGRFVKKGERGILILAPIVRRKAENDEDQKESSPSLAGFRAAYVFDVSQTDGKELPQIGTVHGDPSRCGEQLRSFASGQRISVDYSMEIAPARGMSSGGRITLLPDQPPAEEFSTLAHELAHELLHRGDRRSATSRRIRETEAEATAFVVCHAIGLETGSAASDYIQLWNGDAQLLTESLAYIRQAASQNGSTKLKNKVKMLGSLKDYPREADILHLKTEFMLRINAGRFTPETNMTLSEFVEKVYLPYVEELRASTKKGYREIWTNHISNRVGSIRMREFRTVDASRMLKAIAGENDLTKTTLQHIKSVLSAIFTHAKNEGAFDGVNPVQDARIPRNTREPGETFAYNLSEIRSILDALPLLPKAIVATASFAGLRHGELRALGWSDYQGDSLNVSRSIWKTFINRPKTRASAQAVPVIRQLAEILNEYRISMGNPKNGVVFHSGAGEHLDFDRLGQRVVRPAVESLRLEWHGWHGFRRGIASNLYELGANDKIVQRILRHAKPHVTRERYIKAFDPAVLAAMKQMEAALDVVSKRLPTAYQLN